MLAAAVSITAGVQWLALAVLAAAVGAIILGVSFGLYQLMIGLGRLSPKARLFALITELILAPAGFAMAVVGNQASNGPTEGPFADGDIGLMVLLGGAFAGGGIVVVLCLLLPRPVRRLFASVRRFK